MSISFQTNYASLVAQNNLSTNTNFQTRTIEQLTSGYRINQSGDDAAGLAVANQYQSTIAELTQGVLNGNQGVNALQIADGGLSNITTILNRLKTLATESASTTFQGDRANINVEYQQLVSQVSQQASNIGLAAGGQLNALNSVYIGGGNTAANSQVTIDLSGAQNQVDATALGISNTSVLGGGTTLPGNTVRLDAPGAVFLAGSGIQNFDFNLVQNNNATHITVSLNGGTAGLSAQAVVNSLNSQLSTYGIAAQIGSDGQLTFGGGTAFTVEVGSTTAGQAVADVNSNAVNTGVYSVDGATNYTGVNETLTFQNAQGTVNVALTTTDTVATALAKINAQTSSIGIYAVQNFTHTGVSIQSTGNFSVSGGSANATFTAAGAQTTTAPTSTSTVNGNAVAALTAINSAIVQLGQVQARIGAGENHLTYAISLANSQITNFSAAESGIRDADVATAAANLTKAQVLQQASVAALAQANSAPQALLKLLQQ